MRKKDIQTYNPDLALDWDYEKNAPLTPANVSINSAAPAYWRCHVCGREWRASPMLIRSRHGCPSCWICISRPEIGSLAESYPEVAKDWDYTRNKLAPKDYRAHSNKTAWWVCPLGHSWAAQINSRTRNNHPSGCPVCAGKQVLEGYNDLLTTNPELCKEWDKTLNTISPRMVARYSGKQAYWICPKGHSYKATIRNRSSGHGCPVCAGKKKHKEVSKWE